VRRDSNPAALAAHGIEQRHQSQTRMERQRRFPLV
jgi:hypothetical protein